MKLNKTIKLVMLVSILLVLSTTYTFAQECAEGTTSDLFAGSRPSGKVFNLDNGAWSESFDSNTEEIIWSLGYFSVNNYLYAGSANSGKIYEYDGCVWSLSIDTNEVDIKAIEEYDGKLYASSGIRGKVFVFDGSNWVEAFDPPDADDRYGYTLKTYNGKLYYGTGWRGGTIYVYDGASWERSTNLNGVNEFEVYSLEVYNGKLYAGTGKTGQVFVFDGNSWSYLTTLPQTEWVWSLKTFNGNLYAGTHPNGLVYRYNGNGWTEVLDSPSYIITSLEEHDGSLYAGTTWGATIHKFTPGDGWSFATQKYPEDSIFSLESGCIADCRAPSGCIQGRKKNEVGNNLQGWTIKVRKQGPIAQNPWFETKVTNQNGFYKFSDLEPGNYIVREEMKFGWELVPGNSIQYAVTVEDSDVCSVQHFRNQEIQTFCGDSIVQCLNDNNFCEECDDGNTNNFDSCRNDCTLPYCGDGIVDSGEECDDGNNVNGDGCNANCEIEEGCVVGIKRDDFHEGMAGWEIHAKKAGQPDSSSVSTVSGPGGLFSFNGLEPGMYEFWEVMQSGWEPVTLARFQAYVYEGDVCTEIAFKNRELPQDGCLSGYKRDNVQVGLPGWDITAYQIGGSLVEEIETDGTGYYELNNLEPGLWLVCEEMQDGWQVAPGYQECYYVTVEPGEVCAEQSFVNKQIPKTYCGDGEVQHPNDDGFDEFCDDGNLNNFDSCRNDCTLPYCGDGIQDPLEECDDGNNVDTDDCRNDCTLPYCGDGTLDDGEECDDGNNVNGDGCSSTCDYEGCVDGIKRDDNHVGLPGWEIHAKKAGQPDSSSVSTVSGNGGLFSFYGLEPGMYEFWEVMQSGWEPVTLARFQAEVLEGEVCTPIAFKNRELPQDGCLSGYKRDNVQIGLPGWTITAQMVGSDAIYLEQTDGTGQYMFDIMSVGLYQVCEEMQDGWEVAPGHQECYYVTVSPGELCSVQDFMNQQVEDPVGCLEGFKRDNVSIGLPGWEIRAYKNGVVEAPLITETDGTGYYKFEDMSTGSWTVLEIMQEGWAVNDGYSTEYVVEVAEGDVCAYKTFVNKQVPLCIDECNLGDTMCQGDDLLVCGNFDDDECYEWNFAEDCYYHEHGVEFNVCEFEDSYLYVEVDEGFCNDVVGNNDYCDSQNYDEEIEHFDCGETECEDGTYCEDNDIYSESSCILRGCEELTGLCYEEESSSSILVEDCGEDSSDEYCDGQSIVRVEESRSCVEETDTAFCVASSSISIIEDCGPDTCTEYTVMDPFTKEYVYDEEACNVGELVCVFDPGQKDDYCINEQVLSQSYCQGNDYAYLDFDCTSLSGCYDFTYDSCETCWNPEDARCDGDWCEMIGQRWHEFGCQIGEGVCSEYVADMIDIDNDMIDDRCDDCIDVDHDGVCDDVDTCVGIYNPTNVDSDNDGLGNACDDDRDNDGYTSDVDCDDWNPEVNPGAEEVLNNGRDDDCNAETLDKGTYTPRQALWVDITYDEQLIEPGQDLTVVVKAQNNHRIDLDNVKYTVSIPGYTRKQSKLVQNFESGNTETKVFKVSMPNELSGFEYLRVSVSNDEYKRIIYRELKLPE